jgi:hypothetical protein
LLFSASFAPVISQGGGESHQEVEINVVKMRLKSGERTRPCGGIDTCIQRAVPLVVPRHDQPRKANGTEWCTRNDNDKNRVNGREGEEERGRGEEKKKKTKGE